MWPNLKVPDPLSVQTAVLEGASATATLLDCERHPQLSQLCTEADWMGSMRGGTTKRFALLLRCRMCADAEELKGDDLGASTVRCYVGGG